MKNSKFLTSALSISISAQAAYQDTLSSDMNEALLMMNHNDIKKESSSILNLEVSDYLAAHRSHSSHRSHRSGSSSGSSYKSTPSYNYSTPSYNYIKPTTKKSSKSITVTSKMKKMCKNLNGYNTWDFKRDIAACKINGKYIKYSKIKDMSIKSDPLGQEAKIIGTYPTKDKSAEKKRKKIIEQAQLVLLIEGLYFGKIDGVLGPKTREAINKFKKKKGINNKSYLGIETLNAMGIKGF